MKMKDMKKKAMKHGEYPSDCPVVGGGEEYPCGLRLMLGNDEIESLGIDVSGMSVGEEVAVVAKATVSEVNERKEMMDGKPVVYRNCTLQITELSLHQDETEDNSVKSVLKRAMEGL